MLTHPTASGTASEAIAGGSVTQPGTPRAFGPPDAPLLALPAVLTGGATRDLVVISGTGAINVGVAGTDPTETATLKTGAYATSYGLVASLRGEGGVRSLWEFHEGGSCQVDFGTVTLTDPMQPTELFGRLYFNAKDAGDVWRVVSVSTSVSLCSGPLVAEVLRFVYRDNRRLAAEINGTAVTDEAPAQQQQQQLRGSKARALQDRSSFSAFSRVTACGGKLVFMASVIDTPFQFLAVLSAAGPIYDDETFGLYFYLPPAPSGYLAAYPRCVQLEDGAAAAYIDREGTVITVSLLDGQSRLFPGNFQQAGSLTPAGSGGFCVTAEPSGLYCWLPSMPGTAPLLVSGGPRGSPAPGLGWILSSGPKIYFPAIGEDGSGPYPVSYDLDTDEWDYRSTSVTVPYSSFTAIGTKVYYAGVGASGKPALYAMEEQ